MASNSDRPADETYVPSLGKADPADSPSAGSATASAVKMAAVSPVPPSEAQETETLRPRWVLCDRYRIVRFIARGGMGEVYEAEDLELGERVALKTVLPQIASDERAMERFKREIQLARKVTHVNVCRINDLFRHRGSSTGLDGPPDVTFLTMELLTGTSLADHIHASEKLPAAEAVGLAIQIARGLSAAHAAGIVHRDLKSPNVMLVPGEGGTRAVITDFGLARAIAKAPDARSLTGEDNIVGTPAYMAPEQIEGGDVTASADLYALGVVLFEMLTGQWPFIAETRMATALKRLTEPPPSPRQFVPDLDPQVERAVLRCLERYPAQRFASADEFISALQGQITLPLPSPAATRRYNWTRYLAAGAVAVAMIAGYGAYRLLRKTTTTESGTGTSVIAARPVAAVLGFKNLSSRPQNAWISTAMSEMLNTELAASDKVRTVGGDEVARVRTELSLSEDDTLAGNKLTLIQENFAANYLILGSFLVSGKANDQIRFDVRLEDGRGETIASFSVDGTTDKLPAIGSQIASHLREKLGLVKLNDSQAAGVAVMVPANAEAARLYSEALTNLRAFDAQAAVESLQKAAAAEPDQPSIHLALASAWALLGYDTRAKEAAQKAFDLVKDRQGLSQQYRFFVEGRYDEASHQWSKAIDVYSSLHRFYPDSLEYGLRLGSAQTLSAHGEDALVTYASLRKLPKPWSLDPRIALGEAQAYGAMNRGDAQLKSAEQAATRADEIHAPLLAAPARLNECIAERKMGKFDLALVQCERAKEIFSVFGDRIGLAWSTNNIAVIYRQKGDVAAARAGYEQALAIATSVGAKRHMAGALSNIGATYYVAGDMPRAREFFQRSLAVSREIDDRKNQTASLNDLALSYDFEGDLSHALRVYDDVAALARQSGNNDLLALSAYNQARAQFELGELQESHRNFEEAIRLWKELQAKGSIVMAESQEAELLAAQGDDAGARRRLDEAEAMAREMKSDSTLASVQLSQAAAALASRRFPDADAYASKAAALFRSEKDADDESDAVIVSARALLEQGKDAAPALARYVELGSKYKQLQLRAQIAEAQAAARAGKATDATSLLRKTTDEAARLGLLKIECDAHLAAATMTSAPKPVRISEATVAATKAKRAGFAIIADTAGSTLRQLR